jgi:hypothetical protein
MYLEKSGNPAVNGETRLAAFEKRVIRNSKFLSLFFGGQENAEFMDTDYFYSLFFRVYFFPRRLLNLRKCTPRRKMSAKMKRKKKRRPS